eukprot:m.385171 g.385171  ORF g.385171 m.385171 type:complete len:341 (-) comp28274_c1_seq10:11985-13007(-)
MLGSWYVAMRLVGFENEGNAGLDPFGLFPAAYREAKRNDQLLPVLGFVQGGVELGRRVVPGGDPRHGARRDGEKLARIALRVAQLLRVKHAALDLEIPDARAERRARDLPAPARLQLECVERLAGKAGSLLPQCVEEDGRVEQVAEVELGVEQPSAHRLLRPFRQRDRFGHELPTPLQRVFRAVPPLCPQRRCFGPHKGRPEGEHVGREESRSLEHAAELVQPAVDILEEADGVVVLELHKRRDGVCGGRREIGPEPEKGVPFGECPPRREERVELRKPQLPVKRFGEGVGPGHGTELLDDSGRVGALGGAANVRRQAKDGRRINVRQGRDRAGVVGRMD